MATYQRYNLTSNYLRFRFLKFMAGKQAKGLPLNHV
jgi:hypothetical protein